MTALMLQDDSTFCIITEVCYGGDLEQLLKERGHLNETETAHVIHAALRVLEGCHKQGICYGDVKPANFLLKWPFPSIVDPQALPDIRVADFGSAQFIAPVSHHTLKCASATCLEEHQGMLSGTAASDFLISPIARLLLVW